MGVPRQEYWSELPFPFPGDLPDPGIEPVSPALAGRCFTTKPLGKSSGMGILIKKKGGGNLRWWDMHTGKMSHNHGGRDQGDASITRQGMPKIASKPPEVRWDTWERFLLTHLKRNHFCPHHIHNFWLCLWQLWKTNTVWKHYAIPQLHAGQEADFRF